MYQHSVSTPHLPWSTPSPIQLLYQREAALSRKADEQAARFAGAFSIRSILSQTRSHVDSMASNQDHRYLSNVPCSFGPPEAVCCSEGSPLQGQTSQITTQLQEQEDSDVATYEPTKYQGYFGSGIGKVPPRKANKRSRTIFTPYQLQRLEKAFERQQYVAGEERRQLAIGLNLTETQVKVWFQNRRIRYRKHRLVKPTTT